jgi:hypothetical protein
VVDPSPTGVSFIEGGMRIKAERDALQRPATPAPHTAPITADHPRAAAWVAVKLQATLDDVAKAPEGQRNHTLNAAAYSLGRLIPKYLDGQDTAQRLMRAALDAGLEDSEARATIRSGLAGGMDEPRDPPIDPDDPTGGLSGLVAGGAALPSQRVRVDDVTVDPETGEVIPAGGEQYLPPPFAGLDLSLLDGPLAPLDFLVDGRLTRRSLTLLGSKPGVGKSWLAQAMTLSVATGTPWLGHHTRPGRVLYLDAENGDRLALRRLQQLGATSSDLSGRLRYVTESMVFPDPRDAYRLRRTLEEFQPDLVVVDTLASIAPSSEAGTEEASTFYATVWHAVRDAGAAMLLLCHLRKVQQGAGKDDPLASFRGAGHIVGAAHRAWVLDPVGDEKFILRDVKTREFAAVPPVRLRLVDSGDGDELRTAIEVEGTVAQVEDGYDAYLANVLTFIDRHPTGMAKKKDLLDIGAPDPVRSLERWLSRAVSTGVLQKAKYGHYERGGEHLS